MIKRTFIASLIILGFLITSVNFAMAAFSETTDDDLNDVLLNYEEIATDKDNIDLREVTCSRDYRRVTLTLKVYGTIEDAGDINIWRLLVDEAYLEEFIGDLSDEEALAAIEELYASMDTIVSYILDIATPDNEYTIIYVNQETLIFNQDGKILDGTSSVSDDTLTITFDLLSSSENLTAVVVESQEQIFSDLEENVYSDDLLAELNDKSAVGGNGNNDDDDDGDNSGLTVFILMIVVIIIAIIAVVVFVIRR